MIFYILSKTLEMVELAFSSCLKTKTHVIVYFGFKIRLRRL